MTPYSLSQTAPTSNTTTATNWQGVSTTSSSNGLGTSLVSTLVCPTTINKGDKKSTLPHFYTITRNRPSNGSTSYREDAIYDGDLRRTFTEVTGPGVSPYFSGAVLAPDLTQISVNAARALEEFLSSVRGDRTSDILSNLGEATGVSGSKPPLAGKGYDYGLGRHLGTPDKPTWRGVAIREARGGLIGALKKGGAAWLTWQYCIRPAINDAWNASMFTIQDSGQRRVMKGSSTHHFDQTKTYFTPRGFFHTSSVQGFVRHKYKAVVRVTDPLLYSAHSMTTFNPGLIAWNMMPFSFVADWFLDIGGYMEQLESSLGLGLTIEDICYSRLLRYEQVNTYRGSETSTSSGFRTTKSQDVSSSYFRCEYERQRLPNLPRPALPSFRPELSPPRLLSAGGLLAGFLKG